MANFADNLESFFEFKQLVLRGVGSRAYSVLTNESFKRLVYKDNFLSEHQDSPDNAKPAMSPELIRSLHTPSFDPMNGIVCGSGDVHNESDDPFIGDLYHKVLGIDFRG